MFSTPNYYQTEFTIKTGNHHPSLQTTKQGSPGPIYQSILFFFMVDALAAALSLSFGSVLYCNTPVLFVLANHNLSR